MTIKGAPFSEPCWSTAPKSTSPRTAGGPTGHTVLAGNVPGRVVTILLSRGRSAGLRSGSAASHDPEGVNMSEKGEQIKILTGRIMDACDTCCSTWIRHRNAQLHREGPMYVHDNGRPCLASLIHVELDRLAESK